MSEMDGQNSSHYMRLLSTLHARLISYYIILYFTWYIQ